MSLVLIFIVTLILQIGLLPGLLPNSNIPELFIPVIITIAIFHDDKKLYVFSILAGLVLDFYFMKLIGIRTFFFFLIANFIYFFRESFVSRSFLVIVTLTLIVGIIYQIVYFIILNISGEDVMISDLIKSIFSLQIPIMMIYSGIITKILNRMGRKGWFFEK